MIIPVKYWNHSASKLLLSFWYETKTVKDWNDDNNKTLLSLYICFGPRRCIIFTFLQSDYFYLSTTGNTKATTTIVSWIKSIEMLYYSKRGSKEHEASLCMIFTILVSFSRDNALFASKAEINVVWNFFERRVPEAGYPECRKNFK